MTITRILFDNRFKFDLSGDGSLSISIKQPELIEPRERTFIRRYMKTLKNSVYTFKEIKKGYSNLNN